MGIGTPSSYDLRALITFSDDDPHLVLQEKSHVIFRPPRVLWIRDRPVEIP